ncbi:MAG TPA: mechanosensitive ion channel family protein, partial [Thermoanaerobaculia bacterium]|nr:mechanosensitive ion channel family protein [Thermoanaerobaculia bacterium]
MKRNIADRLVFPAVLTLIFFAVYYPFRNVTETDTPRYLIFAAYAALILLVVRLIDVVVFDLALRRAAVPPLLRGIVSAALYLLLFGALSRAVFHYDPTSLITGGAVLAAVLGLALQETLGNLFAGIALHME